MTGRAWGAAPMPSNEPDAGLLAVCAVAGFYRISADPARVARDLAMPGRAWDADDLLRAARHVGLRPVSFPASTRNDWRDCRFRRWSGHATAAS